MMDGQNGKLQSESYAEKYARQRSEYINSCLKGTIYAVHNKKGHKNDNVWTLSPQQEEEGWETDGGEPGYGLYPEVAAFYAACINGYPKAIEQIQQIREMVRTEAPELLSRLDSIMNDINE
ncbi:hypothetical protein M5X06_28245 [Paenibacillus alvei]|uniref:Phage protein n=1 Tax=Paenibacillus alvei TaxID=44250 RepID=A0ABT4GQM4_PAEAL|nr:hypothetical protein [Paenibacillus alvei]MCY9758999.1 hypothetical protein [Paenibacillus alvei]MCY9770672.1 hypothetical protein [Paenibacillus alvei]